MQIEEQHIEHLELLAFELDQQGQDNFHMKFYKSSRNCYGMVLPDPCGTICCSLGLATTIKGMESKYTYFTDYYNYCKTMFGFYLYSLPGQWAFHDSWADVDNTPLGAAGRIRYLIHLLKVHDLEYLESEDCDLLPTVYPAKAEYKLRYKDFVSELIELGGE